MDVAGAYGQEHTNLASIRLWSDAVGEALKLKKQFHRAQSDTIGRCYTDTAN